MTRNLCRTQPFIIHKDTLSSPSHTQIKPSYSLKQLETQCTITLSPSQESSSKASSCIVKPVSYITIFISL